MNTLYSMLTEMQSFGFISPDVIRKSQNINKLNASDKRELNTLVDGWKNGTYDEDPEILVQDLCEIVNRYD